MVQGICEKVCRECPFRRVAAPGWLGESSGDPWDFLASFQHGETALPCHLRVNWSLPNAKVKAADAALCRGALTMLRNSCKVPRDPDLAAAVRSVEPDRENVFANPNEFMLHHHNEAFQPE